MNKFIATARRVLVLSSLSSLALHLIPLYSQSNSPSSATASSVVNDQAEFLERLNRQVDQHISAFRPLPYIETTELEPLEERWVKLGFIPFSRASGRSVYPNTVPVLEERGADPAVFAAPGQTQSLVVGLRTLDNEIRDLRVSATELINEELGVTIPASAIEIAVVEYFRTRWDSEETSSTARGWRWHPLRLWPWNKFPGSPPFSLLETSIITGTGPTGQETQSGLRIAPGTTQHFWLRVRVPKAAEPGNYRSWITLSARSGFYRFELSLQVLPVLLKPSSSRTYQGAFVSGPLDAFAARELAASGINAIASWYDPTALPAGAAGSGVGFMDVRQDYSAQSLKRAGLNRPQVIFTTRRAKKEKLAKIFEQEILRAAGLPAGFADSAGFDILYSGAVQALLDHAVRQGLPAPIWGILDCFAPLGEEDDSGIKYFISRARALRRSLGRGVKLISPLIRSDTKPEIVAALAPYIDIWLVVGEGAERKITPRLPQTVLWHYLSCTQRASASQARWKTGFNLRRKGVDGFLLWAFNWPGGGHSWNDFDSATMDWMLSYRSLDDFFVPTPAWEGLGEGLIDRSYLRTLEELVAARAADSPAVEKARFFLARLPALLENEEDIARVIELPPGSPASTDDTPAGLIRRALAGYIIELSNPAG